MNKPLSTWYCDVCHEPIQDVEHGYVIWKSDESSRACHFKIIHQLKCDQNDYMSSAALKDFLGVDGLTKLLSMISLGPIKGANGDGPYRDVANLDEFVDFIRRVQTPFYEEARRHFSEHDLLEDYTDANEAYPYLQDSLKEIAERKSRR